MTIQINYTNKSGRMNETITDVKSYRDTSVWSIEVVFNNGKIESFYSVESVKELSEPEIIIYELYISFINDDTGKCDTIHLAYSKSIDKLKQKAIDTNKNIYDQQWIETEDLIILSLNDNKYSDTYIIKPITLI